MVTCKINRNNWLLVGAFHSSSKLFNGLERRIGKFDMKVDLAVAIIQQSTGWRHCVVFPTLQCHLHLLIQPRKTEKWRERAR